MNLNFPPTLTPQVLNRLPPRFRLLTTGFSKSPTGHGPCLKRDDSEGSWVCFPGSKSTFFFGGGDDMLPDDPGFFSCLMWQDFFEKWKIIGEYIYYIILYYTYMHWALMRLSWGIFMESIRKQGNWWKRSIATQWLGWGNSQIVRQLAKNRSTNITWTFQKESCTVVDRWAFNLADLDICI